MIQKTKEEEFKLRLAKIKEKRLEETIDRAYYHWSLGKGSVIVYLDIYHSLLKTVEVEDDFYKEDKNFIELYRLPKNFLEYPIWNDYIDLLTNDENIKLHEKFGDNADYTNKLQLQRIGIDFDERMREYLMYLEKECLTPWVNKEGSI